MDTSGPMLNIRAHFAWKPVPQNFCVAPSVETIGSLKGTLGKPDGVPSRIVRIVHEGRALLDDNELIINSVLWAKRFSGSVEVAVLYPQRDEQGSVEVHSSDGAVILTLPAGEWTVHTTIRHVKQLLSAQNISTAGKEIVYNALTLPDASNFGQNEIHSGAVLCLV